MMRRAEIFELTAALIGRHPSFSPLRPHCS
jgi:hypothetical protein